MCFVSFVLGQINDPQNRITSVEQLQSTIKDIKDLQG